MTYTTSSGVVVPTATDAYSLTTDLKTMADKQATYENRLIADDVTAMNLIASPELREGVACYVKATKETWVYDGATWIKQGASDSGWITPTLIAGWGAGGGATVPLQYRKVGSRVYFRGAANGGSTADPLFTLPADYRPGIASGKELYFPVSNGQGATPSMLRVVIRQNGTINMQAGTPNFDTIEYMTD